MFVSCKGRADLVITWVVLVGVPRFFITLKVPKSLITQPLNLPIRCLPTTFQPIYLPVYLYLPTGY